MYLTEMTKSSVNRDKIQDFDFKATYRLEQDGRIKVKLLALHHFQNGKTIRDVSELVLSDEKTVGIWIKRFVDFDYEGLIEKAGRGRKPRLLPQDEEAFKIELDQAQESRNGGSLNGTDIQKLLEDKFDCCYSLSGIYTLLDRLGIVWITGRSKHPKSDPEAIEEFKKNFPEEVNKIQVNNSNKNIEVWWQDEARVGQRGTLSRQWATKGTRPRVVRQQQFLSTYIFGAVCPEKDKGCGLILPEANSGMMQLHLNEISKKVDKDCHAILMMDRAGWHTTEALEIPDNISLCPLPAYSPELNPVEQVWQQLRRTYLSYRVFKDYEDIVDSCSKAWNCFCDEDGVIEKLCTRSWAVTGV